MDELMYFIGGILTGYLIIAIFSWADQFNDE